MDLWMDSIFIILFLLSPTFTLSNAIDNSSYCGLTCQKTISINITTDECSCYNSYYCPASLWENTVDTNLEDFPIEVTVNPFNNRSRSALNFTFTVKETRTSLTGVAFRFMNNCWPKQSQIICRYYDWSPSKKSFLGVSLYNDEIYFDYEKHGANCDVQIVAVNPPGQPNAKLNYLFKIAPPDEIADVNQPLNKWKSLLIIDKNSYDVDTKSVKVVFNARPSSDGVTSYTLKLFKFGDNSNELWSSKLINPNRTTAVAEIESVQLDTDYVVYLFVNGGQPSIGPEFQFSSHSSWNTVSPYLTISLFVILFIFIILVLLLLLKKLNNHLEDAYARNFSKVFIVYSHEVLEHVKVVECFAEYLQTFCNCDVFLDKWHIQDKDPDQWVSECLSLADCVIIVWSRGAHFKLKNDKFVATDVNGYLGNDLFSNSIAKIKVRIDKQMSDSPLHFNDAQRFFNISLPYVPPENFPSPFNYLKHFQIPREFNAFLCQLHSVLPKFYSKLICRYLYPTVPYSNLYKTKHAQRLMTAIKNMQSLEEQGVWFKVLRVASEETFPISHETEKSIVHETSGSELISNELVNIEEEREKTAQNLRFPPDAWELPIFGINQDKTSADANSLKILEDEYLPTAIFGP